MLTILALVLLSPAIIEAGALLLWVGLELWESTTNAQR